MMVVACCLFWVVLKLLRVVCWLLFVVRCLVLGVWRLLCGDKCSLFDICWLSIVVRCVLCVVN